MEEKKGLLTALAETLRQYERNMSDNKESAMIALEDKLDEIAKMISSLSDRVDHLSSRVSHIGNKVDVLTAQPVVETEAAGPVVDEENAEAAGPVVETETAEPVYDEDNAETAEPVFDSEDVDNHFHSFEEDDSEEYNIDDEPEFEDEPDNEEELEENDNEEEPEENDNEEEPEENDNEEEPEENDNEEEPEGNDNEEEPEENDNEEEPEENEEEPEKPRKDWYDWEVDYPAEYVEDLMGTMGINDKLEFMRELFKSDPQLFDQQMKEIDTMPNFKAIVQYFRQAHPKWDEESDTVYRFYMHIRRKFRS